MSLATCWQVVCTQGSLSFSACVIKVWPVLFMTTLTYQTTKGYKKLCNSRFVCLSRLWSLIKKIKYDPSFSLRYFLCVLLRLGVNLRQSQVRFPCELRQSKTRFVCWIEEKKTLQIWFLIEGFVASVFTGFCSSWPKIQKHFNETVFGFNFSVDWWLPAWRAFFVPFIRVTRVLYVPYQK